VDEIGRSYLMEMNVGKNKGNKNFKTTISSKTYYTPKTTGECGIFFEYLGNMLLNDGRCKT
jgi:hypothetical protein